MHVHAEHDVTGSAAKSRPGPDRSNIHTSLKCFIRSNLIKSNDQGQIHPTTRYFLVLKKLVPCTLVSSFQSEHVLPTVRLLTATKHDWSLMLALVAAQTVHEMRCVLPGLSTCGATATEAEAYGGDRDVCGTIGRPMNSVMSCTSSCACITVDDEREMYSLHGMPRCCL